MRHCCSGARGAVPWTTATSCRRSDWRSFARPPGNNLNDHPQLNARNVKKRIRITTRDISLSAVLDETPVAEALWSVLPISARVQTWGDEIYFSIPIEAPPHSASERDVVELGAVGFWPPGNALCLFYGRTPMSRGDEIRPASAVNVLGRMEGDPRALKRAVEGATITIAQEPIESPDTEAAAPVPGAR